MMAKNAKQSRALLNELIKAINEVLQQKHRHSLLRGEVIFLKQSIVLLKECKKTEVVSDMNTQVLVIQVVGILTRFFLFGNDDTRLRDLL